jgi:cell surface protein SprA
MVFAGKSVFFSSDGSQEGEVNDTVPQNSASNRSAPPKAQVNSFETDALENLNNSYPYDLHDPQNVQQIIEYDDQTGMYIFHTKVGDMDIATPFVLSTDEYRQYRLKKDMETYWKKKNREATDNFESKFDLTDMKFSLGAADKVFGPGGVQVKTQGSAEITFGIKHSNIQNYQLAERLRKKTVFDFDEKIQMNVKASVGDKISFGLNYDTESTFDFDRQNLKLAYEGKEDDWIKKIEAGNVAMTLNSALIPGSTTLFGFKTDLQFGKLSVSAVLSQQQSSSQNVNTNGGVRTINFDIPADGYDANRHYFLAQYFRDTYDKNMEQLPYITSGVTISKIEVWITNKRANYQQSRNIIAFVDLGESQKRNSLYWGSSGNPLPANDANMLYDNVKAIPDIRNIQQFTQLMDANYFSAGIVGGEDYEKIESARRLEESEYTLNPTLGFLSLRTQLNTDEVLAVAFEYTIGGKAYQVGEFSTGSVNIPDALIVKLLKSTATSNSSTIWNLMMKNVYSLGASQFQKENFKLNVMYKNDSTGVYLNYIPAGNIKNRVLLKVMNLDRLDSYNNPRSDGKFDFVEGYTIISSMGRVIFPVIEPFGSHLRKMIGDDAIADKYVFEELYDSTMVAAGEFSEKNKFKITGSFQGTSNSEIYLNAMNVPRGSVVVTAGGVQLVENVDYTIDYIMGVVTILNQSILASNTPVDVRLENREMFNLQRKTLLGTHLEYAFSKDFTVGGTLMHLSEMPIVTKTMMGSEPISNTIWGLNAAYKKDMQWLTTALDKLPLLEASAPSSITFNGEFAQMIPGHRKIKDNPGYAYLDDFEATETTIELRYPYYWYLASTPAENSATALFPEALLSNNIDYGKNRALLAWYAIDNTIFNSNSSSTPEHLRNNKDALSNHLTRAVREREVFPNRESMLGQTAYIPVMNLSFYPNERGPYNLDTDYTSDGKLINPKKRWGGMMRKIDVSDFEQANIEYIEFWLMDPFVNDSLRTATGGDLYINLGEISEDILKDGKKFFENGMPVDGSSTLTETTVWGKVPTQQSTVLAFSTDANSRRYQDVGYNGLRTEEEFEFPTYGTYLQQLRSSLAPAAIAAMEADPFSPFNDPAGDNFHYFRGSDYDRKQASILERYKHYNGTEGNSAETDNNGETYATSTTSLPDVEDINQDNTLNEYEKYFQYKISLKPGNDMDIGNNYITDKLEAEVELANKKKETVTWYQYKIPVREFQKKVGAVRDFKSIRFMRIFLTNFEQDVHLRFATLELVRGDWRTYTKELYQSSNPPAAQGTVTVGSVNIEKNSNKEPVNYVLPPGVTRQTDPGQPQLRQQNEQSMVIKVMNIAPNDARAVYKMFKFDLRQYRRLQLFTHAEKMLEDMGELNDYELSVFIRIGSDFTNNYYEYEIPLRLTPQGHYIANTADMVWYPENMFDFPLSLFTDIKKKRNLTKNNGSGVSLLTPYSDYDPEKPKNKITIVGNPNLGEVETVMIGVRNKGPAARTGEIWVNELRLTDYDEDGGVGALGSMVLALSDFANVNLSGRYEQSGFGGIEQSIGERRLDDYYQFNVATSVQLGKLLPEKAKVNIPVYYSYAVENTKPKYNPFDGDLLLKDALDSYEKQKDKDSLLNVVQTKVISKSFNVTGLKVDIRGKRPHIYDPANFSLSYAYNKSQILDPETERNANITHQGSLNYDFNTQSQTWEPFKENKKIKSAFGIIKDFGLNYVPARLGLELNVIRMYSETQLRNIDGSMQVDNHDPYNALLSSSKNFNWGRNFVLNWDFTKNLKATFQTATNSRIDETMYAPVNREFFPDEYQNWKDTVSQSLRHLGTPLTYQQNFDVTYNIPINKIPFLEWINASARYNATYNWNLGAMLANNVKLGNSIANSAGWSINGDFKLETLYNKSKYLKSVNDKYNSRSGSKSRFTPRTIEKRVYISKDSAEIRHGLNSVTLDITAKTTKGRNAKIGFKTKDKNSVLVTGAANDTLVLTIQTADPNALKKITSKEVLGFSTRFLMMMRSFTVTYKEQTGIGIPGFVGQPKLFGQSSQNSMLLPGLDFAFGMPGRDYLLKAMNRGWITSYDSIINPVTSSFMSDLNIMALIEPFSGFKINVTARRNYTNSQTIQYMFDDMPTAFSGTFTMTHIAIGTAFWTKNTKVGNQRAFDLFNRYRGVVANRIQDRYTGTSYPAGGFMQETGLQGLPYNAANGTVTPTSTDAMIPAFMAAYSGRSVDGASSNIIPSLLSLLPNWSLSYTGLTRIPFIAKVANTVTLNHTYASIYGINSYTSFASYIQNENGLGFVRDATTGNPIPSSGYDIAAVTIAENFLPFIGIDVVFKNSFTGGFKYNRSRTISLNLSGMQIGEIYTNEFVVGIGYIIKDFDMIIKLKTSKIKRVKNNLTTRLDFSIKDMATLLRKIDTNEPPQATAGNKIITIKATADYVFSSKLNLRFFFDYTSNAPIITTSYPMSNINCGLTIKFMLTR